MSLISDKVKKFTRLYSDLYPVVYNGIYTKVRDTDITSELSQEVFTRFYEKFDEVENPRRWLLGTLKNVLMEYYKSKSGSFVDIEEVISDTNLLYVNGFRDTRIILQNAFDASENYRDEQERIIYELVAVKNYSYDEVAQLMGLTRRQVEYRYRTVADRIVDYLKKKGINSLEELL